MAEHLFCGTCGVCAFYRPRSNPDGVAVTAACLRPGTVTGTILRHFDGAGGWEAAVRAPSNERPCAPRAALRARAAARRMGAAM